MASNPLENEQARSVMLRTLLPGYYARNAVSALVSDVHRYAFPLFASRYCFHADYKSLVKREYMSSTEIDPVVAFPKIRDRQKRDFIRAISKCIPKFEAKDQVWGRHDLEDFLVSLNMTRSDDATIKEWVKFALGRNVKNLTLDFDDCLGRNGPYPQHFEFDYPPGYPMDDFNCLKCLTLTSVVVGPRMLNHILALTCQQLETLIFRRVKAERFSMVGLGGKIKYLELTECWSSEGIRIRNSGQLISLKILNPTTRAIQITSLPKLEDVAISWGDSQVDCLRQICPVLQRLRRLSLSHLFPLAGQTDTLNSIGKLDNLRELELVARGGKPLWFLTSAASRLIPRAPQLQKLVIKVHHDALFFDGEVPAVAIETCRTLKVLEYHGYNGRLSFDNVIIPFVVESCPSLTEVIISTAYQPLEDLRKTKLFATEGRGRAKTEARKLRFRDNVQVIVD